MSTKQPQRRGGAPDKPAKDTRTVDLRTAMEVATKQFRAGKLDKAEELCRKVLQVESNHAGAMSLLGMAAAQRGENEAAVELLGAALAINPSNAKAHNNLGMAQANRKNFDEAIASYRRAIELDPDLADAHNNLGNVLRFQQNLEEAGACYRRVIEINPNIAAAHNNLGMTLEQQERADEAIACFQRALGINPKFEDAHVNLAGVFRAQERFAEAETCYRRALELKPDNATSLYELGNVLKDQEKLDEAVAAYERALEINPDAAETHNSLGIAKKNQDKLDEAVACYQRSIALLPENAEAHNNLGNALKDQGKIDEAIASYRRAMEFRANFAEAYCNFAKVHDFAADDPEVQTLKDLYDVEDMSEDNKTHILVALGKAHDDFGSYGEAFSYHERANKETARARPYDATDHRRQVAEIIRAHPQALPLASLNLADVERIPVFVIGNSRSGKSLAESLLCQHPDVYGAGESREWTVAVQEVAKTYGISMGPLDDAPPDSPDPVEPPRDGYAISLSEKHVKEIGERYLESIASQAPEARYFVNTMPTYYPHVSLILRALPAARVIYCRRDPLDNCLFMYFYRYKAGNGYSYNLENTGSYYADYQDVMTHWLKLYGDRILSVRYEDLVGNPVDTGTRIFEYCGLEYDPKTIKAEFTADEIGRAKHYEPYLGPLRKALGKWADA